ncbi:LppX_LprAFG lipoprotein [Mycolicibacterium sp.]|uniref:LppX_LprAFG lipoprotein n=1 Tax=Mycolicibacterium sp. TaxID=2320850 RepID=UPI00356032DC
MHIASRSRLRTTATAAALALLTAGLSGCLLSPSTSGQNGGAHPGSPVSVTAFSDHPAQSALASAAASARSLRGARVLFSTTGVEDLTASSYAANIVAEPASAAGSGNLLINGERSQTDFRIEDGRLWIKSVDGTFEDVAAARGNLDPTALLDPATGLAAMLEAVTAAEFLRLQPEGPSSTVAGRATVKMHAQLPEKAATLLLPATAVAGHGPLPVTLWLDPTAGGYDLVQLIAEVGEGSMTLTVASASH